MNFSTGRILFFVFLVILMEYYTYQAFITGLSKENGKKTKATIAYIITTLITWLLFLTFRIWDGWTHPRNVKALLTAVAFGLLAWRILMTAILLLGDIYRIVNYFFKKRPQKIQEPQTITDTKDSRKISRSTFLARFALLMGGVSIGLLTWGTRNRYRYQLIKIKTAIKDLPEKLKGITIAQISDIHSGSFDNIAAVQKGIELLMAQKPDLIVFTGDLVNQKADEVIPYMAILKQLKAPLGVYSILGNHDYGDYISWPNEEAKIKNLETLKEYHRQMGWQMLNNEHVILSKDGAEFALMGVENWSAIPRFPRKGNLKKAYQGLENKNLPLKILLSHDPTHWDAEVNTKFKDIDLTLSGHTHGFQFGVEIPGFKWSPARFTYKQWAGLYAKSQQYLYVNRGYGFIGYQGRVGILPEITLIELA